MSLNLLRCVHSQETLAAVLFNAELGCNCRSKMLHTSIKPAIWTRKLTSDTGKLLKTIKEDLLCVEGKGFLAVKIVPDVGLRWTLVELADRG